MGFEILSVVYARVVSRDLKISNGSCDFSLAHLTGSQLHNTQQHRWYCSTLVCEPSYFLILFLGFGLDFILFLLIYWTPSRQKIFSRQRETKIKWRLSTLLQLLIAVAPTNYVAS